MVLSEENLNLCVYWYGKPMTGREYIEWLSRLLLALQRSAPCFARYAVVQPNGYRSVSADFSNLESCVADNQPRGWAFEIDGSDSKRFTLEARPKMSFSNAFVTSEDTDASGCMLSATAGSRVNFSADSIVLTMSADLATPDLAERVFKTLIACSAPNFGVAVRGDVRRLVGQPVKEKPVGWLTYWDNAQCTSSLAVPIKAEALSDGLLIRTEAAPPGAEDAEALNRLRKLIEALRSAGCLSKPAFNPR
ncbi:hypothetical protein RugamoR64_30620 [Duganella rhizosphaerae]|uniref:hypothetical protein n=1 Tax=Duganella rhizosphaerae TaxID=2885763 RepID=UPI0030E77E64